MNRVKFQMFIHKNNLRLVKLNEKTIIIIIIKRVQLFNKGSVTGNSIYYFYCKKCKFLFLVSLRSIINDKIK